MVRMDGEAFVMQLPQRAIFGGERHSLRLHGLVFTRPLIMAQWRRNTVGCWHPFRHSSLA